MIDCLVNNLKHVIKPDIEIFEKIKNPKYFILTLHRPSNVDDLYKLNNILKIIDDNTENTPILFPIHPRTQKNLNNFGYKFKNIKIIEPQKYLEFIFLIKNSMGIITDSGGITEESTFLNIPCLTLRNSTERPETVEYGTNILIGDNFELLKKSIKTIIDGKWKTGKVPELWDGLTSKRIINHILKIYEIKKNN
jgi:UDP-N-acetylglucosamine 2-epimerase (non-hydrolysing)